MLPTDKQIAFAAQIAHTIGSEFPWTSKQYTKTAYSRFINANIEEYKTISEYQDPEDYVDMCMNDVWTEHY